jgi:hypothetical protein
VDLGGNPQRHTARYRAGCCVVSSTQPPPATFNYARDILSSLRPRRLSCQREIPIWVLNNYGKTVPVISLQSIRQCFRDDLNLPTPLFESRVCSRSSSKITSQTLLGSGWSLGEARH